MRYFKSFQVFLALTSVWLLSGCSYLNEKPQPAW